MNIDVKVDGLEPLAGGSYDLKCNINSCAGYGHVNFYNVTPGVRSAFGRIAFQYNQAFTEDPKLVVTDASLEWGGLYDFKNTWAPPHFSHRIGTDIDVRSWNIPGGKHRDDFKRVVCDNGGFPNLEYPGQLNEHYHLYFSPYTNKHYKYCK